MRIYHILVLTALAAACGRGGAPAAGGGRGPAPAAGVGIVTLQPQPIEDGSDFIATIRSLHSTTVQPQVDGVITKIFVKSGDTVRPGSPILQIDPEKQAATVRNAE